MEERLGGDHEPGHPFERRGGGMIGVVDDDHRRPLHERVLPQPVLELLPGSDRLGPRRRIERQAREEELEPVVAAQPPQGKEHDLAPHAPQPPGDHRAQMALATALVGDHQGTALPLLDEPFQPG